MNAAAFTCSKPQAADFPKGGSLRYLLFVRALSEAHDALEFHLIGYVLMPEHFHLLLWPGPQADPSVILQSLKVRTALPATVHSAATHRVWQRRFYDLNIWSDAKVREKLKYMHGNPVKRGLVRSPEQWRWSSFLDYHLQDGSPLTMDRLP